MDDLLLVVFWIELLCSVLVSADICFDRSANDGFYTTSTGQDPNRAYGLGMCAPGLVAVGDKEALFLGLAVSYVGGLSVLDLFDPPLETDGKKISTGTVVAIVVALVVVIALGFAL
ncbi:hypothetical protein Bca52824_090726 [Brassica carinata]|uniref:Uncharacterized protein n=1 Tax=Brassica carinata TaxID=52824 RepID=A0A8X7NXV7_BRACI|nr:hypothetical protein Bca52824_090726 [Brassica carinata]